MWGPNSNDTSYPHQRPREIHPDNHHSRRFHLSHCRAINEYTEGYLLPKQKSSKRSQLAPPSQDTAATAHRIALDGRHQPEAHIAKDGSELVALLLGHPDWSRWRPQRLSARLRLLHYRSSNAMCPGRYKQTESSHHPHRPPCLQIDSYQVRRTHQALRPAMGARIALGLDPPTELGATLLRSCWVAGKGYPAL